MRGITRHSYTLSMDAWFAAMTEADIGRVIGAGLNHKKSHHNMKSWWLLSVTG